MKLEELGELHYITPILNVPSILDNGILSFNKTKDINHESCASSEVQGRRMRVIVPGGKPLHDYANLYFNARNPMMYRLKDNHLSLAVLAITPNIIGQPGVIISDCNAARDMALFKPAPDGLELVDLQLIYAEDWRHPNPIEYYEHQGKMCAEVLVPDKIDKSYIFKIYVSGSDSSAALVNICGTVIRNISLVIHSHLFFQ